MRRHGLNLRRADGALTLRPQAVEVARGRQYVRDACQELGSEVAHTAALLTSELITNAILHGAGEIKVMVTSAAGCVRVDVTDQSTRLPVPGGVSSTSPRGRGLSIVERLADSWGADLLFQGGKSVWFTLKTQNGS